MIFVFGSNQAGRHGAGAALHAKNKHGAIYGMGEGRQGSSYAIPTKDRQLRPLPLQSIFEGVQRFIEYARKHPDLEFEVTKVGCGLAGYSHTQIGPMFRHSPSNCKLPKAFEACI